MPRPQRDSEPGRAFLVPLLLFAIATAGCDHPQREDPGGTPERIILVSVDTLRADRLGCYGASAARTPTLDRLATGGIRFEHAIAPAPITQPSHATLLTGLDPPRHGLRNNGTFQLAEEIPTLAERLRSSGFTTAAFVGAVVLEGYYGFAQGFEHFDDRMERTESTDVLGANERPADVVIASALSWLETAPDRFFVWIHLFDPHEPYEAPGWMRRRRARSPYDAEINFVDAELGRLTDAVEKAWPDGRTLFVVTSDHGESLGEHGERTHAYSLYDATQRVPLILQGGGLPQGRVLEPVVRLADVAPTLLALVGAPPLENVDGRDLRPLWEEADPASRVAFVETLATQLDFGWSPLFGLRTQRYKYIRAPRPELYDVEADPAETENLASELPEIVAELDRALDARLENARPLRAPVLDPMRRRQLEELGYLVAADPADVEQLGRVGGPDPKDHMQDLLAFRRAKDLLSSGQPRAVLETLSGLPDDAPFVAHLRADAALEAGDAEQAERYARVGLHSNPEKFQLYVTLGNALLQQRRVKEADQAFQHAARLSPATPEPLVGLGLVAESRRMFAEAEALYRRAAETRIVSTQARWLLAALYIERGQADRATALLDELHEEILLQPMVAARLALAEARAGRREQALARLENSRRHHPASPLLERSRKLIQRLDGTTTR